MQLKELRCTFVRERLRHSDLYIMRRQTAGWMKIGLATEGLEEEEAERQFRAREL